ncbi:MAG TPA: SGNH/GDSL hydrolase family protein [Candidatus Saccharimonadales bacterium]|nr:SGNH/GDSL hydrolase family protein [Candidatus Saccharimonadales bacterium]
METILRFYKRGVALTALALVLVSGTSASATAPLSAAIAGDSFISGQGGTEAGPYLPGTDTESNKCHRSTTSPVRLLAMTRWIEIKADASCSGATTANMTTVGQYNEPAQITQLPPDVDRIYLMISGNDALFGKLLGCFLQYNCDQTPMPADSFEAIRLLDSSLDAVSTQIKQRAPKARVVVQLYPRVLPPTDSRSTPPGCAAWLNRGELELGNVVQDKLNNKITAWAKRNNFRAVDASGQFKGHSLCDGKRSWFYQPNPADPWSTAHPTLEGRSAMAIAFARGTF